MNDRQQATYSKDEILSLFREQYEGHQDYFEEHSRPLLNWWLERGDGIAVYENQELGHPDNGVKVFVSFGSPAAQLETEEPPRTLPDGLLAEGLLNGINWRYQLIGTYRGEAL